MPHLFCRVLELPVAADSRVQVQESPSSFTFKVVLPPPLPQHDHVRAQIIHIVPGVTKVCVAGAQIATAHLDELDAPLWRFRLPASSIPESSTAACYSDGLLVLTVPKSMEASPSLIPPYQVSFKNTPTLDADPHADGLSCQLEVCSSTDGVSASLRNVNSTSTAIHHDNVDSEVVKTGSISDVKEHDANMFSADDKQTCSR